MKSEHENRKILGRKPAPAKASSALPVWDFYEHWPLAGLKAGHPGPKDEDYRAVLSWCLGAIDASPTGRQLLEEACAPGWRAGLNDLSGKDFYLDIPQKIMLIDNRGLAPRALAGSGYFRHALLINMIRALRDIWQEKRHGGFDDKYGPEGVLLLERVRAADGDVMAALVAWELRGAGRPEIWRYLVGTEEGDIALAFSNYLEKHPSSLFNGKALAHAFRQWYRAPERINGCDHETLEYLDEVLAEGGPETFGRRTVSPAAVEVLSCLPDKTAYLQGQGRAILQDPAYYGLSDPINQTHLFHIMYDMEVVRVGHVPFRDEKLARLIFPDGSGKNGKTRVF